MAAVDNMCKNAIIYRGKCKFHVYEISDQENFRKKDTIDLRRELIAVGINDFDFTPGRDVIQRIRFIGGDNPTHFKIYMQMHGNEYFTSTVKLADGVSDWKQQSRYDDEPIF